MGIFATTALPLFISLIFLLDKDPYYEAMSSDEHDVLYVITIIQGIQCFFTWTLVFASCGGSDSMRKLGMFN